MPNKDFVMWVNTYVMEFYFHQSAEIKLNKLKQNVRLYIKYSGICGTMAKVGINKLIWPFLSNKMLTYTTLLLGKLTTSNQSLNNILTSALVCF